MPTPRFLQEGVHTVLLRSDGCAVACGMNADGQCNIPLLGEGLSYTQVCAGYRQTWLLKSDGSVIGCGDTKYRVLDLPTLDDGVFYMQVSAGQSHAVLLQSDGCAVACGRDIENQCTIPPLTEGLTYTQVSAGHNHTLLLRSDGSVVACGANDEKQCSIPALEPGKLYIGDVRARAFQVTFDCTDEGVILTCWTLAGQKVLPLTTSLSDLAWYSHRRIAQELKVSLQSLRLILPDGQLFASICRANAKIMIEHLAMADY